MLTDEKRARDLRRVLASLEAVAASPPLLFLDTETTGLEGEVVELGIVDWYGRVVWDGLIRPTVSVEAGARGTHGIGDGELEGAPTWADVHGDVRRLLERAGAVVAYNAKFDERAVGRSCAAWGLEPPRARWYDLMRAAAVVDGNWDARRGSYRWPKLTAVAQKSLGPLPDGAHRALYDAELTRRLFRWVLDDLRQRNEW